MIKIKRLERVESMEYVYIYEKGFYRLIGSIDHKESRFTIVMDGSVVSLTFDDLKRITGEYC